MAIIVGLAGPAALLLLGTGVCSLVGYMLYMVYFHPLAKYPGPFLAKFTHAYAAYHAFKQDIHLDMWRCHEKYGDFVRYGPDRMLINTATGLKDIYGLNKNVMKSQGYNAMIHRVPSVLTIRNKKEHSDRRRLIGEGLSDSAIRKYEPVILKHIDELVDVVAPNGEEEREQKRGQTWSVSRNMAKLCNYLAFDIMSDVVFGMQYNLLSAPKYRFLPDAIAGSNIRTTVLLYLPGLVRGRLDKKLFPACIKARNAFLYFISKLLNERLQVKSPNHKDVFSALMSENRKAGKEALGQQELGADSTTLVIAGSDTTSTAMSSVFFYLAHNRSCYQAAVEEVRSTFASRDEIRISAKLNSCVYLRACIEESMRITPPIGASLFREAGPGGVMVDGHFFPAGMDVGTSIYSIQHKAEYYPRPYKFEPERWILKSGATTTEQLALANAAMNPFSIGQRACIGKSLAIVELMLTFATVLWALDCVLVEGKEGETGRGKEVGAPLGRRNPEEFQLHHGGITSEKEGPMLKFSRREVTVEVNGETKE
ncbi:benzoate 4-monooxygenase cytochrome P450 [Amylocarpus encephaloides]|uniref:Benzoate 4-monooxygenase cytochrome P450 n=1 Tax=Amylocarpus encephaloides TaxID=45428 RepID=A0A9P8C980_9HELO|nr:benzoate 4-monooxygenase cytochrome P450 [Amylocarpus encephaloides]